MQVIGLTTGQLLVGQVIITQNGMIALWQLLLVLLVLFLQICTLPFELLAFIFKIQHIPNLFKGVGEIHLPVDLHHIVIVLNSAQGHDYVSVMGLRVVLLVLHTLGAELVAQEAELGKWTGSVMKPLMGLAELKLLMGLAESKFLMGLTECVPDWYRFWGLLHHCSCCGIGLLGRL